MPRELRPQAGPQEAFLSCQADGAIFGGAAMGGKSFGILLESTRYIGDPHYTGIIFRRKSTEITTPGALWDTALRVYGARAQMRRNDLTATFKSGCKIRFSHLEYEDNKYDHQGGQYCFIAFDELITFTRTQFFFLLTRNRPADGCFKRPYWRATCNPDADSWVRELVDWWIDPDTGYAIPERSGVIRYYTVAEDEMLWVDEDWRDEDGLPPRSFTFIPSYIEDNPIGMKQDPSYRANLRAQDAVTRERLEKGNWNISYRGGMFKGDWFIIEDHVPRDLKWQIRYWDFAATEKKKEGDDPDWSAGALLAMHQGELWIGGMEHFRTTPAETEKRVKHTAQVDGREVAVAIEEERGSSGKFVVDYYRRKVLKGYEVYGDMPTGDKVTRAKPIAALAEQGNVHLVRGEWNRKFLAEAGSFPLAKKDQIDAVSGGYKVIHQTNRVFSSYVSAPYGNFADVNIDFGRTRPADAQIYGTVRWTKEGALCGNWYYWGRKSQTLRVYWEKIEPNPTIQGFAREMVEASQVPMKQVPNFLSVERVYGNAEMFMSGEDVARVMRKGGLRVRPNPRFEESGALLLTNTMFAMRQIIVSKTACPETDTQYKTWCVEKGRPSKGFPLCRSQLVVVNQLRVSGELSGSKEIKPYSKEKRQLRDKLRGTGPLFKGRDRQNDWLAT